MSGYSVFAAYYDRLQQTDYVQAVDGLLDLFSRFGHKPSLLLDLACGTGGYATEFAKKGIDVIGVDASAEMLTAASKKARAMGLDILYLCQRAEELDLYGSIDTCVCMLDSLNHILDKESLNAVFEKVSLFMNPGGLFVFDLNTAYKHRELLGNQTYVFQQPDLYCVWQNEYDAAAGLVEITLDFFERQDDCYVRFTEQFCERDYPDEEINRMIAYNHFETLAVYGDAPFAEPSAVSARKIYVVRKKYD